jgi:glycosyltransferase involved in cell wall biosynthesis
VGYDEAGRSISGSEVVGRRILYIHGIEAIGGAERDLIALLGEVDRQQWEPHVICPGTGPFRNQINAIAVPTHALSLPPWRKPLAFFQRASSVRYLGLLVNQLDPAVIHVNDIWWVPHTIRAVARHSHISVPIVAHVRQEIEPVKVRKYGLDCVDAVIAISRQVEQSLIEGGVPSRQVRTIYSGIDLSEKRRTQNDQAVRNTINIPNGAVLLGTVANLFPRKGYEIMLKALPAIMRAVPNVHYLIVGSGETDYADRLKTISQDLGIGDRVHLVGFQELVQPFLAALDLYVHPALMEGFGIAVVEAMAMGKAVVATRVGGLPEVVTHGETGLLVSAGDAGELSRAVVELLQDRPRRERMGSMGVTRAREQFDLKGAVGGIEQVYRDVLAERQPQ